MRVIKQNKLVASILTSDILYFNSNLIKNKNSNFFLKKLTIKNKTQYILLDIILFLQSIKQIIRLLQYNLKYYKNFLQIITSNTLYNQIIEYTSKMFGIKHSKISGRVGLNNKLNSKVAAYIIDDTTQNIPYLIRKTFYNNIYSIILINSYFSKNIQGDYKMFAKINNYKKLLFLITIILLSQKNVDKKLITTLNSKKK